MISRTERHRKRTASPKKQVFTLKHAAIYAGVAVLCFGIGIGISYVTSMSDSQTVEMNMESPATGSTTAPVSPQQGEGPAAQSKPAASVIPSASPTLSPSPSAAPAVVPSSSSKSQVKLAFVGDVLLASKVEDQMKKFGYDYPYAEVKEYLTKADYTIANLETPVTERGEEQIKEYAYRSSPLALPALAQSGIDLVNLANNHVMDYGKEGLLDTFKALDHIGIKRIGAGVDAEEAYKPVIVEKQGVKIAFLGFSRVVPNQSWKAGKNQPGVAETYNYTVPVEAIGKAKQQADLVVVITHWGIEREDHPDKFQKELAHRYIDAGADLIVGGHPHVVQGFEKYKGKWIAYSLGNFIFTMNENPKTWDSMILEASCSKEQSCELHVVPVLTKLAQPVLMNAEQGAKLLERLSKISIGAKVGPNGAVTTGSP